MPNTTNFSLPFPQASDSVDVPRDIGALATAVDTRLLNTVRVFATTTARDSAITSPAAGMVVYINSDDANEGFYFYTGAAWLKGASWNAPWGYIGQATRTTAQSSIGTTVTDLTGLSVTFTALANRRYKITGNISVQQKGAASLSCQVLITDGSNTILQTSPQNAYAVDAIATCTPILLTTFSAGSQTVKLRASTFTSTMNTLASSTQPGYLLVEDMGPSGAPA